MNTTTKPIKTETDHEIEFITNLGLYSDHSKNISRANLLRGYLDGASKRTAWGWIDKARVVSFAASELFKAKIA